MSEIQELKTKIDKLTGYIYNDSTTGRKGLVQQFDELKITVDKIIVEGKITSAKRAVWNTVFGFFGGGLIIGFKFLIAKIF